MGQKCDTRLQIKGSENEDGPPGKRRQQGGRSIEQHATAEIVARFLEAHDLGGIAARITWRPLNREQTTTGRKPGKKRLQTLFNGTVHKDKIENPVDAGAPVEWAADRRCVKTRQRQLMSRQRGQRGNRLQRHDALAQTSE